MWIIFITKILFVIGSCICTDINIYEVQGSNVLFYCPFDANGNTVIWKGPYEDNTIYSQSCHINSNLPNSLSSRIFITGNHTKGEYNLRLVKVQISDAGLYSCSVNNKETTFNLTIPALIESTASTYNRFLLVDEDLQKLIVGQMNNISLLDLSEDAPTVQSNTVELLPEADKVAYCTYSHPEVPECQNHIRFITKKTRDTLILCGSNADSPKGYELNITDMSQSTSESDIPCSNDPFHNFTAVYVESHDPNGAKLMYYASTLHGESTIQRPIPGSTDYMKGVISNKWMKDPQFVASFDINDKVYFFFRETAIEVNPDLKKIYSRVAKVCKKDTGGDSLLRNKWTSFQKARLTCFNSNENVYLDSLQDVVLKDSIFYGLFINTQGTQASAICAFNLSGIAAAMNGTFKVQESADKYWTEVTNVPSPRPGQCTNDSLLLSEEGLQFIADHPLMHNTVEQMYVKPIFILDDEELQHLELHNNMSEMVFYAASNNGKVYKLFFKEGTMYTISTYSPLINTELVWALKQYNDSVYIGTDTSVKRLKVINCEQFRWIDACIKDPHCAWVNSSDYLTDNIDKDDIQCYNRCRSLEAVMQDPNIMTEDVLTHLNQDPSKITPVKCPPSTPMYMRVVNTSETVLTIRWKPGSSGDNVNGNLTFVIKHKICGTPDWSATLFSLIGSENDPQIANISNLIGGILYDVLIIAKNTIGSSSSTDAIIVSTLSEKDEAPGSGVTQDKGKTAIWVLAILLSFSIVFIVSLLKVLYNEKKKLLSGKTSHKDDFRQQFPKTEKIAFGPNTVRLPQINRK